MDAQVQTLRLGLKSRTLKKSKFYYIAEAKGRWKLDGAVTVSLMENQTSQQKHQRFP